MVYAVWSDNMYQVAIDTVVERLEMNMVIRKWLRVPHALVVWHGMGKELPLSLVEKFKCAKVECEKVQRSAVLMVGDQVDR